MKIEVLASNYQYLHIKLKSRFYDLSKSTLGRIVKNDSGRGIISLLAFILTLFSIVLVLTKIGGIGGFNIIFDIVIFNIIFDIVIIILYFLFPFATTIGALSLLYLFIYAIEIEIKCNKATDKFFFDKTTVTGVTKKIQLELSEINEIVVVKFYSHREGEGGTSFHVTTSSGDFLDLQLEIELPEKSINILTRFLGINFRKCVIWSTADMPEGLALHMFLNSKDKGRAIKEQIAQIQRNSSEVEYEKLLTYLYYSSRSADSCYWREGINLLQIYSRELVKSGEVEKAFLLNQRLKYVTNP